MNPVKTANKLTEAYFFLKVWPMGAANTVSRLPITVKVVPVSSNEEEGGREQQQQQQGEPEEEGSQQQSNQSQGEEEAVQTGIIKSPSVGVKPSPILSSDFTTMLEYRSCRWVGGDCDWASAKLRGGSSGERAERASSSAAQPDPAVPSSDQTDRSDRQLLPVPVLCLQIQNLLSAQVPSDPAQRGAGENRSGCGVKHRRGLFLNKDLNNITNVPTGL